MVNYVTFLPDHAIGKYIINLTIFIFVMFKATTIYYYDIIMTVWLGFFFLHFWSKHKLYRRQFLLLRVGDPPTVYPQQISTPVGG